MKLKSDLKFNSVTRDLGLVYIKQVTRDVGNIIKKNIEKLQTIIIPEGMNLRYRLIGEMDSSALSVFDSTNMYDMDCIEE